MRLPDLMEVVIAVGAVVTVFTAIGSILYRVAKGSTDTGHIEALKAKLLKEQSSDPPTPPKP
jgi:hypothetical protein